MRHGKWSNNGKRSIQVIQNFPLCDNPWDCKFRPHLGREFVSTTPRLPPRQKYHVSTVLHQFPRQIRCSSEPFSALLCHCLIARKKVAVELSSCCSEVYACEYTNGGALGRKKLILPMRLDLSRCIYRVRNIRGAALLIPKSWLVSG